MCEALPGFDSYWAVSPTRENELGEKSLLAKNYLRPTQNYSRAKKPNTNQMPSGICTAKRRCGSKGLGPRGRGRGRIATPWPLPRVSKPCKNQFLSEKSNLNPFTFTAHFENRYHRPAGCGRTTIHPLREGFASPKRCKTASDLPTTRFARRDRS